MKKNELIAEITTSADVAKRLARRTKPELEALLEEKIRTARIFPKSPVQIGDEALFESNGITYVGMIRSVDHISGDNYGVRIEAAGFQLLMSETNAICF